MNVEYNLSGTVTVPDGSRLTDTGTGIILPDGRVLKLWEVWEIHTPEQDDHRDLEWSELIELGCFYDGSVTEFQETQP